MMTFHVFCFLILVLFTFSTNGLNVSPLRGIRTTIKPGRREYCLLFAKKMDDDEGYDPLGSLTRQGLVPYVIRIVNPSTYDAAVLKYMKLEKCSKTEAMANMDAYFADPNGWAARKIKEKKGLVPKTDYVNSNQDQSGILLTLTWSVFIVGLFLRVAQVQLGLGG